MADDGGPSIPGAPSFEQFKKMMESDVEPNKLSIGEQVQKGLGKSWANPAYWSRQFVTAQARQTAALVPAATEHYHSFRR